MHWGLSEEIHDAYIRVHPGPPPPRRRGLRGRSRVDEWELSLVHRPFDDNGRRAPRCRARGESRRGPYRAFFADFLKLAFHGFSFVAALASRATQGSDRGFSHLGLQK